MGRFSLLLLISVITMHVHAQMQDLYQMSNGELRYSKILFDEYSIWGYFYLYEVDNLKDSTKMEYIILDKNLNKMYNGNFYEKKFHNKIYSTTSLISSIKTNYANCLYMGDKLVLDIVYQTNEGLPVYNSNREIAYKENRVSDEFILQNNVFSALPEKLLDKKERTDSLKNKIMVDPIYGQGKSGYLIRSFNTMFNERYIKFYDANRNYCWKFEFDSTFNRKKLSALSNYKTVQYLFMDSTQLYLLEHTKNYEVVLTSSLIALDIKTGKLSNRYAINPDSLSNRHSIRVKALGDSIAVYGEYNGYGLNKDTKKKTYGHYRILLDKQLNQLQKKYVSWPEHSTANLIFKQKGYLKKPNRNILNQTQMMFEDGSMVSVNQEFKTQSTFAFFLRLCSFLIINADKPYYQNLCFVKYDKDFKPIGVDRVEMSKNYDWELSSNFHFSQYHDGGKSGVACFFNKTKMNGKSETELVINSIKGGEVKTERIPLTSKKKFSILPQPAKDGYIMLNEYNIKDKHNEVRLERLNN